MPPISSGCGCCAELPLHPTNRDRCRSSLDVTTIGELVWLSGLDSALCERFQRLSDVLSLKDCNGNPININTPLVTCAAFKTQLCAAIAGLVSGGEANEFTQLVGVDCKLYTIPRGGVIPVETPNTVTDSSSIDLTASGTLGRNISAAVKLSSTLNNALVINGTGLYVPTIPVPLTACEQIGNMTNGGDAGPGTVLVGGDCIKYTFPASAQLSVTDTSSIDLTLVADNLSAALRLDPDSIGRVTADGLEITCADVRVCAPPVTVTDTSSVDLTLVGQALSATVKRSAGINDLVLEVDGLSVDICTRLAGLPGPTPAVAGVTELVGSDCNTYTLPTTVPVTVSDTTTINMTLTGTAISAVAIVTPNTLLTVGPSGLAVTCEDTQDCIWTTPNNFFSYNDGLPLITFVPSSDVGNQIITGSDGRPLVAADPFSVDDTDCINLSYVGNVLTAQPIISPAVGNGLSCLADGLFSSAAANINVIGGATDCATVFVNESPAGTYTLTVVPTVSLIVGNALECTPDGLYVSAGAVTPIIPVDTLTVDLTVSGGDGHTLQAAVNVSAFGPNVIQVLPDGLFVNNLCGQIQGLTDIGAVNLDDYRFVGEITDGLGNITCHVGSIQNLAIGLLGCNTLALPIGATVLQPETLVDGGTTTDPNGIVVFNAIGCPQSLVPPACNDTIPYHRTSSLIIGENQTTPGTFQFQRSGNQSAVVTAATLDINTVGFAFNANIFLVNRDGSGSIDLPEPTGMCSIHEVWIKNVGNDPLNVNSVASLIDGVGTIELLGQDPGNYPFNNNGGESVHIIFDDNTAQWYVI